MLTMKHHVLQWYFEHLNNRLNDSISDDRQHFIGWWLFVVVSYETYTYRFSIHPVVTAMCALAGKRTPNEYLIIISSHLTAKMISYITPTVFVYVIISYCTPRYGTRVLGIRVMYHYMCPILHVITRSTDTDIR